MSRKPSWLKILGIGFLCCLLFLLAWLFEEFTYIRSSIAQGWFEAPQEFYTAPLSFKQGQKITSSEFMEILRQAGFKERGPDQSLGEDQFTLIPAYECESKLSSEHLDSNTRSCLIVQTDFTHVIQLDFQKILVIQVLGEHLEALQSFNTKPLLFSKWSGNQPVLRTPVSISQIPRFCLDAVLAIEDDRFLRHHGISPRGILRAALANLKSGRFSQGGSTLTQQLIKNRYLTAKKSLSRKGKEAIMALLIEFLLDKDEILETYLNYIYWGQSGPYAVHGIQEAARHYYNKDVGKLNLAECSLLAGAIKGPGIYGPHRKKKSKKRQLMVLDRMEELSLINPTEKSQALSSTVSVFTKARLRLLAPYYIDAVRRQIKDLGIKSQGLKVYTELDFFAQRSLEKAFDKHLKGRSKGFLGSYILGDNRNNSIIALTSGLSTSLNFNSALFGKRHIGSLAKPFVYLNAFLNTKEELTPLTKLSNKSFTYKYEGQKWTPKNYSSRDTTPSYPLHVALVKSKNIPTVRLLEYTGHKSLHKTMRKYGFGKPIPLVPSISLGAFEQSPMEVLEAYMNFASEDKAFHRPAIISRITNSKGSNLFKRQRKRNKDSMNAEERVVLEIMKKAFAYGTATRASRLKLEGYYGGKTGTSNDHKDGWFASVSPDYTSIVWVGEAPYLTKAGGKITGASAALPIWMGVTKELEKNARYSVYDWDYANLDLEYRDVETPQGLTTSLLFKRDWSFPKYSDTDSFELER